MPVTPLPPCAGPPSALNSDDVWRVMVNGRLHDAATLDELWPRMRAAGPFYGRAEDPVPTPPAGIPRR